MNVALAFQVTNQIRPLQHWSSAVRYNPLVSGMKTPRRDHACMWVEFESSAGVLVTGGLGAGDEVLSSAEFYDVNTEEWHQVTAGNTVHMTDTIHPGEQHEGGEDRAHAQPGVRAPHHRGRRQRGPVHFQRGAV